MPIININNARKSFLAPRFSLVPLLTENSERYI